MPFSRRARHSSRIADRLLSRGASSTKRPARGDPARGPLVRLHPRGAAIHMGEDSELDKRIAEVKKGGASKYHAKAKAEGKRFVRERMALLLDPNFEVVEGGLLAHGTSEEFPADGGVTDLGKTAG